MILQKCPLSFTKLGKVGTMGCSIVSTILERPSVGPDEALQMGRTPMGFS